MGFYGLDILPATPVSKHWSEYAALSLTSGLESIFFHPLPASWLKGHCCFYIHSLTLVTNCVLLGMWYVWFYSLVVNTRIFESTTECNCKNTITSTQFHETECNVVIWCQWVDVCRMHWIKLFWRTNDLISSMQFLVLMFAASKVRHCIMLYCSLYVSSYVYAN